MNPTDRRLFLPYLLTLLAVLSRSALAQLPDIVGTWERADAARIEFTPQRTILEEAKVVGKWRPHQHGEGYVLNWKGNQLSATLDKYQRKMTAVAVGKSGRTVIERVDDGPTRNPDVPDQRTGWELEMADLTAEIRRMTHEITVLRKEAEVMRDEEKRPSSKGRKSYLRVNAGRKEGEAKGLERSMNRLDARLKKIRAALARLPVSPPAE